jgi:GDP-L-fucose synthase
MVLPEDRAPLVNVGSGADVTIRELAGLVREIVACDAEILWDHGKPDGTPRKLLDISAIGRTGWRPTIELRDGIRLALADFTSRAGR